MSLGVLFGGLVLSMVGFFVFVCCRVFGVLVSLVLLSFFFLSLFVWGQLWFVLWFGGWAVFLYCSMLVLFCVCIFGVCW